MQTYFYFPAGRQMWFDLTERLSETGVAEPVLWLGDPTHDKQARARFPNAEIAKFKSFTKTRRAPEAQYDNSHPEFWFSDEFFRIKERAIKLMDRADPHEDFRSVDREVFFNDLVAWGLDRFATLKPDFLLFAESPHTTSAYVLYEVAKYIGIPVYLFVGWSLMPILSLRKNIDGQFLPNFEVVQDQDFVRSFDTVVSDYLAAFEDPSNYAFEPRYMKIQQLRDANAGVSQRVKRILTKMAFTLMLLSRRKRIASRRRRILKRAMTQATSPTIPENYVYFPLHYEPERTTNPDGGIYHDQMRTLAHLRALIPSEMRIVVKEHPSVFTPKLSGHLGRSSAFYDMISKIRGVDIVTLENSSADLILGSQFVASITGTVALEAAILGRPALTFGSAWFEGCPGIHKFSPKMDFDAFLKLPSPGRTAIHDWMNAALLKRGMPGCVNPSNERYFSKYYEKTNLRSLERDAILHAVTMAIS